MNIIVDAGKGMIIRALLAHPYRFLHLSLYFSRVVRNCNSLSFHYFCKYHASISMVNGVVISDFELDVFSLSISYKLDAFCRFSKQI